MELPFPLQKKIIEFLASVPNIHDSDSQRALIFLAGFDALLQDQIPIGKPPGQFVPLLISTLLDYGTLRDGRNALDALLEATRDYVGHDKKVYCDTLLQELHVHQEPSESHDFIVLRGIVGEIDFNLHLIDSFLAYNYNVDDIASFFYEEDILFHYITCMTSMFESHDIQQELLSVNDATRNKLLEVYESFQEINRQAIALKQTFRDKRVLTYIQAIEHFKNNLYIIAEELKQYILSFTIGNNTGQSNQSQHNSTKILASLASEIRLNVGKITAFLDKGYAISGNKVISKEKDDVAMPYFTCRVTIFESPLFQQTIGFLDEKDKEKLFRIYQKFREINDRAEALNLAFRPKRALHYIETLKQFHSQIETIVEELGKNLLSIE